MEGRIKETDKKGKVKFNRHEETEKREWSRSICKLRSGNLQRDKIKKSLLVYATKFNITVITITIH